MSYDPSRPAPEPGRVTITAEDVGTAPGFREPDVSASPRAAVAAAAALVALAIILHRLS